MGKFNLFDLCYPVENQLSVNFRLKPIDFEPIEGKSHYIIHTQFTITFNFFKKQTVVI